MEMSRRLVTAVTLLLAAAGLAANGARAEQGTPARRPNLVFILSDDQRFDTMGCAGNRIIRTPNMDALARGGVRFKNAFVTTPICAASRATLLTGLYERTHRFTFSTPPIKDAFVHDSYPARLRQAGYRTGFVGKIGVLTEKGADARMFDYFRPLDRTPYFKKQPDGSERFLEDILGDRAVEFLDGCNPDQPFNLSLSFNAPHAEDNDPKQYFWPTRFDALYRDVTFPIPKTMSPEFWERQPEFLKNTESRVRYKWRFDEPQKYQEMVRGYYRMITAVDDVIGRVRSELDKRGLADNTVIVFMADNGYFLGERGFADKWYGYEYSLRVPMIVLDPRLERSRRGKVADAVALNVDIAPTLLDLAGIPAPARYQGHSLLPLVHGKTPAGWRQDFFFEHLFERDNIPKSEGVRTDRWTYIRWFQQHPLVEELYDHDADFEETRNLVGSPKHRELLQALRSRTDALRDSYGGPYVPHPKPVKAGAPAN
jgi:arylsulfatase A-like enzyme